MTPNKPLRRFSDWFHVSGESPLDGLSGVWNRTGAANTEREGNSILQQTAATPNDHCRGM